MSNLCISFYASLMAKTKAGHRGAPQTWDSPAEEHFDHFSVVSDWITAHQRVQPQIKHYVWGWTKVPPTSRCPYILWENMWHELKARLWQLWAGGLSETNTHRHLWQIITCFRTDEFLRPLRRGRDGRETNGSLSLCLRRKSIYTLVTLCLYTQTHTHMCWEYL